MRKLFNPITLCIAGILVLIGFVWHIGKVDTTVSGYTVIIESVGLSHTVNYPTGERTFYETYCRRYDGAEVIVTSQNLYKYAKDNVGKEVEIQYVEASHKGSFLSLYNIRAIFGEEVKHAIHLDSVIVREGSDA